TVGKGPLFGLPKDFTTAGFYVNVDLFNAAGVEVPYEGWTWKEFEEDCRRITALTQKPEFSGRKIYGSFFQLWPDSLRNVLWTFGGDYFDGANFRKMTLGDPPAQEALE